MKLLKNVIEWWHEDGIAYALYAYIVLMMLFTFSVFAGLAYIIWRVCLFEL